MPIILNKHIKDKKGKYIIFCKNKKHLAEIKDIVIGWFHTAGFKDINSYVVHSSYEGKDTEYKAFCEDTSNNLKLLFCVNMLNEGLHLENISGVLLLRPTNSNIVWHQQIGRAIEANNTKNSVIIDAVNNFSSVGQGMGLLREIKDAVAKEKESNPEFDDSSFMDIDTFFVLENVLEIQEMFKEIEGRLQGSWDLYIKALMQYKEREGDCDVPSRHIEQIKGTELALGNWCQTMRAAKEGKGSWKFTKEMKEQLDAKGFVWDVYRYRFENNIKFISEYYKTHGEYPSQHSENLDVKKVGGILCREKIKMRNEKDVYPEWKMKIIRKYLPDFSYENRLDKSVHEFIHYAKLYKKRFGHTNIKGKESIDSFNIGRRLHTIQKMYQDGRLTIENIKELQELGICLEGKFQKDFNEKMELAKRAVKNGVIISRTNRTYEGENLNQWIQQTVKKKYKSGKLSYEEKIIIESLTGKIFEDMFKEKVYEKKFALCKQAINEGVILTNSNRVYEGVNLVSWIENHKKQFSDEELEVVHQLMPSNPQNIPVRMIDITNDDCKEYASMSEAARDIQKKYKLKISSTTISNLLNGKSKKPYKERFMFYSVDDETARKVCTSDNKAS